MADLSDVETAFCRVIESILYPDGTSKPSITGGCIKIFRGWPANRTLNADLGNGVQTVTVSAKEKSTRNTTRYPRIWRPGPITIPTMSAVVVGDTLVLGGSGGEEQTVGVVVDGVGYAVPVGAADTTETVAKAIAAKVGGARADGSIVTMPGAVLEARVAGSGTSVMETRRQEQVFLIGTWCPSPVVRDLLSGALDNALSALDWLVLDDGSTARVTYSGTSEVDTAENANLYRRNLEFTVEYATLQSMLSSQMLFGIGTLGGSGPTVGFNCLEPPEPMVVPPLGAVRFDAWYDPANPIDQQCAAVLSNPSFNVRLPPNAVGSEGGFTWPRATQDTMDAEIQAALDAGLGFWAFDSYSPTDTLSLALQLYLSSSLRGRLKFCMLGQTSNWGEDGRDQPVLFRDIDMMTQPGYMTVLGGRPLYLVLDASFQQVSGLPTGGVAAAIAMVRQQVQAAGGQNPYIVWLSGAALADYSNVAAARMVGADAAAAYANPRLDGAEQSYPALTMAASSDWSARAGSGFPMLPTAMTGWDQRPLIERPQPFYPIGPGLGDGNYYDSGTAEEIATHVADMARFVTANPAACPAQVGLVYAWNELAEGGWLMPTYTAAGPDLTRTAAVGRALIAAVEASRKPSITLVR